MQAFLEVLVGPVIQSLVTGSLYEKSIVCDDPDGLVVLDVKQGTTDTEKLQSYAGGVNNASFAVGLNITIPVLDNVAYVTSSLLWIQAVCYVNIVVCKVWVSRCVQNTIQVLHSIVVWLWYSALKSSVKSFRYMCVMMQASVRLGCRKFFDAPP